MKFYLLVTMMLCGFAGIAQNTLNATLKDQLIKDWERGKSYTQEYLDAMPADKYGFRPVDSIRSFAEQMLHFAQANAALTFFGTDFQDAAIQKIFFSPGYGQSASAKNKDSVVYYVNSSYTFAINAIKSLNFDKLSEEVTRDLPGGKRTTTRLGWLMKAFEHQTHHRGQCTIYIRLNGIRPPGEKLF